MVYYKLKKLYPNSPELDTLITSSMGEYYYSTKKPSSSWKFFRTIEERDDYIFKNKPFISINNIIEEWGLNSDTSSLDKFKKYLDGKENI